MILINFMEAISIISEFRKRLNSIELLVLRMRQLDKRSEDITRANKAILWLTQYLATQTFHTTSEITRAHCISQFDL